MTTLQALPELDTDIQLEQVEGFGAMTRCSIHQKNGKDCEGQAIVLLGAGGKKIPICRTCCTALGPALLAIGVG